MAKNDEDRERDRDHEVGRKAAEIEAAARQAQRYRRMDYWRPYPKQADFIAATLRHREVGFFAATQVGKTETAAFVAACNLTGLYPKFWKGRRFDEPIDAWAVAENLKMARDIIQKKLCGEPGDKEAFGSGMIPRHLFVGDPVMARGEGDAYDTIQVRHVSGGVSTLRFRTYQAGRAALQGATLDFVWLDEEPEDLEVYSECLARISARPNGLLIVTFTPLKGMSGISIRYRQEHSPDRTFVQMGIDDVPPAKDDLPEGGDTGGGGDDIPPGHIPLGDRERIIGGYPVHEREARSRGEPMLGEGRVYATPENQIVEDISPLSFPLYWRWGYGFDIGIAHPWSAVLMCHDTDQDVIHLVAELRIANETPAGHFAAIRQLEKRLFNRYMDFPVAWPRDADSRAPGSGESVKSLYKQFGLRMMAEPATLPNLKGSAAVSLEGGVQEINTREKFGKWKVARNCLCYLEERRLYHRKDGEIVKLRDDTLAAARYGLMMRRFFKPLEECGGEMPGQYWAPGPERRNRGGPQLATGIDFPLF